MVDCSPKDISLKPIEILGQNDTWSKRALETHSPNRNKRLRPKP